MKKRFQTLLIKIITFLQKVCDRLNQTQSDRLPYIPLSPTDDADIEGDYKKALDWALKNRRQHDIRNVAVTGPYGSGKTSILKTYIKKYRSKKLQFLNISLATFKEEEINSTKTDKDDLLRLIELSILQQIFYREKDSKILDSRFRKIKNFKKGSLLLNAFFILITIQAVTNLIYPKLLISLFELKDNLKRDDIIHFISLAVVIIGLFLIIYRSIRVLYNLKINKLNIQNAEISIDDGISKSILNNHIDEILYFFEVTKYNTVIIEDLDRFRQTEIFTKLREINLLINNSKKIKKDVIFIYAVRDDMFKEDNERTKFFDFIIPVIPIINPSNSGQKLLEIQRIYNYKLSENLIDSISLFIDDMRMLYNITNEYYLYHEKLNKSLDQDKLLSIIVYKNIFPNDFTLLSNSQGSLFECIDNKNNYINKTISQVNEEINKKLVEIKRLQELRVKNLDELRSLYLLKYINYCPGLQRFIANGEKTVDEMKIESNFDYLINNTAKYYLHNENSYYARQMNKKFVDIEKEVDSKYKFSERKVQIENLNDEGIETLKIEIEQLEKRKLSIRNYKIIQLLQDGNIEINLKDSKQHKLISVLLRNGFIDENYLDYLSIFYEGSLTKADYQFLLNVKSQTVTSLDYKLNNIDKLIKKINILDFDKEFTLNYSLLDFVLAKSQFKDVKDAIFHKIKDESKSSIDFIDGFIDITINIELFMVELVRAWSNIWMFLKNKSSFTKEKEDKYFKLIIEYSDINDLVKLYQDVSFKNKILQNPKFLNITSNSQRLKEVITALQPKFISINSQTISAELFGFIYENDFYEINIEMVALMLKTKGKFNQSNFDQKNYWTIKNSEAERIKKYINENLDKYIENLYVKIESNVYEDESCLLELFNSKTLSIENKVKIITQTQTKITDLLSTDLNEIDTALLIQSKVNPTWENIFTYYENQDNEITQPVIDFFNANDNASKLSEVKIQQDKESETVYTQFITKLITTNTIEDEKYNLILNSVPYIFPSLNFQNLSEKKQNYLVQNEILVFNKTNYDLLKSNSDYLHIKFIEINKSDFLNNISEYEITSNDLLKLLHSEKLNNEEKNRLIEHTNENSIISNANIVSKIGSLVLEQNTFRLSDSILKVVVVNKQLSIKERIQVFNLKHNQINIEYLNDFLISLGEPYSDITIRGKRPSLDNNGYNQLLAEILKSKNYISSYSINEDKGIKIATFKEKSEEEYSS